MAKGGTAVYLYCVVRAARKPALTRVPRGLPDASRPEAYRLSNALWLITAQVPLDRYDPAHLEPRLRDLDWVSDIALAHEAVVEYFARAAGAVVVPMKLFTMFSSMDKAAADVAAGRAAIERAMRHIAGCEEWGVRITRRPGGRWAGRRGASGVWRGVPRREEGSAGRGREHPSGVAGGRRNGIRAARAASRKTRTGGRGGRSPAAILRFSRRRFS